MKRIFIVLGILCAMATGCNSGDAASKDKEANIADKKTAATAKLTDISTSRDVKTLLAQSWENKDDAQEAALSGGSTEFDMPYRGFAFSSDGSLVQNARDDIRFGKWGVDDAGKKITITYADGKKAQYTIAAIDAKNMVLMNAADKKKTEYKADGKIEKNILDDPFYTANNQWRIKPAKPETDEAVKQRLQDCLNFYTRFLNDNVAKGGNVVSFIGFPSIFVWYKGAISVIGEDKMEQKWINCFYNKEQAAKARAMVENIITKKYKWDKTETSWVKQDADGIKQIADTLAAVK